MITEAYTHELLDTNPIEELETCDMYVDLLQTNLDSLIHEPKRLAIMLILTKYPIITFTALQKLVNTSSGNLTSHLKHLSEGNLVNVSKTFVDTRPSTIILITIEGRKKLKQYYLLFKTIFGVFNL